MSPQEKALAYPAGEWFDIAQLTDGASDYACWKHLCESAMAQYRRPSDQALLTMDETRSRFRWQPRIHPGEIALAVWLQERRERRKRQRFKGGEK